MENRRERLQSKCVAKIRIHRITCCVKGVTHIQIIRLSAFFLKLFWNLKSRDNNKANAPFAGTSYLVYPFPFLFCIFMFRAIYISVPICVQLAFFFQHLIKLFCTCQLEVPAFSFVIGMFRIDRVNGQDCMKQRLFITFFYLYRYVLDFRFRFKNVFLKIHFTLEFSLSIRT